MPEVAFSFNSAGGAKFGRLTGEHVPIGNFQYKLAIVLDDVLQTAPTSAEPITDSGRITGNFTQQEVDEIVEIINAGSLPAALEPDAGPRHDHRGHAGRGDDPAEQARDDHRLDRGAAVHALLLPFCRPGGRAGPGA